MKKIENNKDSLLKTDGGQTKSNSIEVPSISLPKGGGAIKGIDEKFSVNAVNGTASFSIPLPFSPARGLSPSLNLSYNSGAGNGIFGLGWNIGLASIKRKSDKGLPQYFDAFDSDTFLFSEAEDLVPEFKKNADGSFKVDVSNEYIINEKDSTDGVFIIRYYRPRIEALFARIERWSAKNGIETRWKITTRDNTTTLFGWTQNSRISDPEDKSKIYEWWPEFVFDDKGNCAQYIYKTEDSIGFDNSLLHNKNRIKNGVITYTNVYLDKVLYGNKTPYKKFGDAYPLKNDYLFSTVFDYGTLLPIDSVDTLNAWKVRPDAFSDYKSGFEIRTTRLCKRVLLFHHFKGLNEYDGLVRSINFEYGLNVEEDFTFLKKIRSHGYIKKSDGGYSEKSLPPMEFTYQAHDWNKDVQTIATENLVHAPCGLNEPEYLFTDLYNEGLNGILTEQANRWYYKHNLGDGKFEQAKLVTPKPSFSGLGSVMQLADLDADGGKQLVSFSNSPTGYFELDDENEWQEFQSFKAMPNIDFRDKNTRMLDLNGDGKPDVVISEDNVFSWYPSEGREGFSQPYRMVKPFDEEEGAAIVFVDLKQTIFLADFSGSGLSDIVRIRNGEVCYWPNLGYGKFGAKVGMDNPPVFDAPDAFNPSYLRLADIDGSGTSDIIYLAKNKFTCWKNLSGNRFATDPFTIDTFPEIHTQAKITVTDLLGTGVACIVWSSPLAKDTNAPLKFVDLMNSKKPHIMVSYKNNMGKEVGLEYKPSTKFYLEDKKAGKPWITKLHFPIHCVSKTITEDKISGSKFVSEYRYHHGYYDHAEGEFRGFGMAEQIDAETFEHWKKVDATNITEEPLHQEPAVLKTWNHTGAFLGKERILNQFKDDYWHAEMERQGFPVSHHEVELPDAKIVDTQGNILNNLNAQEWQEALRACKGMPLRSEIFALDAIKFENTDAAQIALARQKELTPFSVGTHNCMIELIQPKGKNKHAVFVVKESEAISYGYERNAEDPRIAHSLNISLDKFGNVLESVSVVYPRVVVDATLPQETRSEQNKTVIIYNQNQFTNYFTDDVAFPDIHRLPLPSETKTYELNGVTKASAYYSPDNFENILSDTNSTIVEYFEIDKSLTAGKAQRRLIEHIRSVYYNNNLKDPLALHHLESLAFPYQSYQLAYTPQLLNDIYGAKVDADLMMEGKFCHSEGDNNWWIRSGITQFIEDSETAATSQNRFYVSISYTDPYESKTKVKYYSSFFLFIEETEDALGNKNKVDKFNFRTLSPQRMIDINANLSEAITDELGFVKAMAVMGKDSDNDGIGEQADDLSGLDEFTDVTEINLINSFFNVPLTSQGVTDSIILANIGEQLLNHASARFVYDFNVYKKIEDQNKQYIANAEPEKVSPPQPTVVASIVRETHYRKPDGALNPASKIQLSFEYSNGLGKVAMKKVQAEPGIAKQIIVNAGNNTYKLTSPDPNTATLNPKQLRWIGNGKTILNNKGNPVKQYEPYFSVNNGYEAFKELVETGVTPIMFYDAAGRLIKTEMPDGTFSKVEFDSWKQLMYDANDIVVESDWYKRRTDNTRTDFIADAKEKDAADKAFLHNNTPNLQHLNTLGKPVASFDYYEDIDKHPDKFYATKVFIDTEGNLRKVFDARENLVMQYKYDMLGNKVYQQSMDAGQRWLLTNILGNPTHTWDERNHEFQYFYDVAHRPTHSKVLGGDGDAPLDHIFGKLIYAESLLLPGRTNEAALQAKNVLGKAIKNYDTGGAIEIPEYDFKGQPIATTRKLFKNYKDVANWVDANLVIDLEPENFTFKTENDALGRITEQTAPDSSVITPSYNEAGLLNSESILHPGAAVATTYIKNIDYNEKRQREKIIYGNNVLTNFYYDEETFRLKRLESKRQNGDLLQDWYYTYDPVGNITQIEDKNVPVVFFDNQKVTGISEYTYDALYRLVQATGRENNEALNFGACDNWNDKPFLHSMNPGDPMATRNYTQSYQYDSVGNIMEMKHLATGGNWTRNYEYETINNRLKSTNIGNNGSPVNYTKYQHHAKHGFMEELPHLEKIGWNFKEEVVLTSRQHCTDDNIPVITYYQYDGNGQRIRKITENQAAAGLAATKKEERIYVAGYETYRTYQASTANFERESLSLMDGGHRFVMIETVKINVDPAPPPSEKVGVMLVRYQLHNHLGSASLELDDTPNARVISYEEYHPFGTTAYQAKNSDIKSAAKRYRYTGMERDEETGLEYHSARYYLPWLGRWLSSDPIGIGDGVNVYNYAGNNPISKTDYMGTEGELGIHLNPDIHKAKLLIEPNNQQTIPPVPTSTTSIPASKSSDLQITSQEQVQEFRKNPFSWEGARILLWALGEWAPFNARNSSKQPMSLGERIEGGNRATMYEIGYARGLGFNTVQGLMGKDVSVKSVEDESLQNAFAFFGPAMEALSLFKAISMESKAINTWNLSHATYKANYANAVTDAVGRPVTTLEARGLDKAIEEMAWNNWKLSPDQFKYSGNKGLDLHFEGVSENLGLRAFAEAKASPGGVSLLNTPKTTLPVGGFSQGGEYYIGMSLQTYIERGGVNSMLAETAMRDLRAGRTRSFLSTRTNFFELRFSTTP